MIQVRTNATPKPYAITYTKMRAADSSGTLVTIQTRPHTVIIPKTTKQTSQDLIKIIHDHIEQVLETVDSCIITRLFLSVPYTLAQA